LPCGSALEREPDLVAFEAVRNQTRLIPGAAIVLQDEAIAVEVNHRNHPRFAVLVVHDSLEDGRAVRYQLA
jgi:hypothetical protein